MGASTNGHTLVALPNPPTDAQRMAGIIFDQAGGDIVRLKPLWTWHLFMRNGFEVTSKVAMQFIDTLEYYAPPTYQRYVCKMTAEDRDTFDCAVAAEIYRLVHG